VRGVTDIPLIQFSSLLPAGSHPKRPFNLVALCLNRTLGDFAVGLGFAASIKRLFDHARLAVYFHDDRPYKRPLIEACPDIDVLFEYDPEQMMPFEAFDSAFGGPVTVPDPRWTDNRFHFADLVLTPSMMLDKFFCNFEQPARLRIPPEDVPVLEERLIAAGVDPKRWFTVLHYREPGYGERPADPLRDLDPAVLQEVSNAIIDELGGQVVRVGHPGMAPFKVRDGFIDLAPLDGNDFMLQLFAMSRARFMVAGASGPHNCAAALGTPTGIFASTSRYGVWNGADAQLHSHIFTPNGERVDPGFALEREIHTGVILQEYIRRGYRVRLASGAEIFAMAKHLHGQTADTPAWRAHWYEKPVKKPNRFNWPLAAGCRAQNLYFPDLAPKEGEIV